MLRDVRVAQPRRPCRSRSYAARRLLVARSSAGADAGKRSGMLRYVGQFGFPRSTATMRREPEHAAEGADERCAWRPWPRWLCAASDGLRHRFVRTGGSRVAFEPSATRRSTVRAPCNGEVSARACGDFDLAQRLAMREEDRWRRITWAGRRFKNPAVPIARCRRVRTCSICRATSFRGDLLRAAPAGSPLAAGTRTESESPWRCARS